MKAHHNPQLFRIRLWPKALGHGRVEWRGEVCHLPGGETRYFRDWSALVACLQEVLADIGDVPRPLLPDAGSL